MCQTLSMTILYVHELHHKNMSYQVASVCFWALNVFFSQNKWKHGWWQVSKCPNRNWIRLKIISWNDFVFNTLTVTLLVIFETSSTAPPDYFHFLFWEKKKKKNLVGLSNRHKSLVETEIFFAVCKSRFSSVTSSDDSLHTYKSSSSTVQ